MQNHKDHNILSPQKISHEMAINASLFLGLSGSLYSAVSFLSDQHTLGLIALSVAVVWSVTFWRLKSRQFDLKGRLATALAGVVALSLYADGLPEDKVLALWLIPLSIITNQMFTHIEAIYSKALFLINLLAGLHILFGPTGVFVEPGKLHPWLASSTPILSLGIAVFLSILFKNSYYNNLDLLQTTSAELQEQVLISQRLLDSRTKFLASISHELRTPLNVIVGTLDLLESTTNQQKRDKFLSALKKSAFSLENVVNDFLDFSKIDAGKLTLEDKIVSIPEIFEHVESLFKQRSDQNGNKIETYVSEEVPEFIKGDPYHLLQIINNLPSNAIKFTENGTIAISATREINNLEISVLDDGIGMKAESIENIFNAYEQAESYTSSRYGGTGLGLPICKELVSMMGGTISCKSELGIGTKFIVVIPLKEAKNVELEKNIESQSFGIKSDLTILVAEDNEINQLIISTLLEEFGFSFDIAKNGQEAIGKFADGKYDLILMDIQMPMVNGIDATIHIRKTERGKNTKIIALTANTMADQINQCREAGMDDFLSKPLKKFLLLEMISHYFPGTKIVANMNHEIFQLKQKSLRDDIKHSAESSESILNVALLREEYDDAENILTNLVSGTLKQIPTFKNDIRMCLEKKDFENLRIHAHTFKGVVSNLYVEPLIVLLQKMENYDPNSDIDLTEAITNLEKMTDVLTEDLRKAFPSDSAA